VLFPEQMSNLHAPFKGKGKGSSCQNILWPIGGGGGFWRECREKFVKGKKSQFHLQLLTSVAVVLVFGIDARVTLDVCHSGWIVNLGGKRNAFSFFFQANPCT